MPSSDYPKCVCGQCRLCKQREAVYRYRARHPDRVKETKRRWNEAHPGYATEYWRKNREKRMEQTREYRLRHPDRVRAGKKRWMEANPDYAKEWRKRNADAVKRWTAESHARYPERIKARAAVGNAIQSGKLKRGVCEICGSAESAHGHHDDYSKPLDVRWLCAQHHADLHRGEPE